MSAPSIYALASDPELVESLNAVALRLPGLKLSIQEPGKSKGLNGMAAGSALVVELDLSRKESLGEFQDLLGKVGKRGIVVAAAKNAGGEDVRRLFRSGAADVVIPPFSAESLRGALGELLGAAGGAGGPVVAVVSGVGGAGGTLVAANLASHAHQGAGPSGRARNVAAIDLDLQFGELALAFDLQPKTTIVDLLKAREKFDGHFLEGVMTAHGSGLELLAAPSEVVPLDAMDATTVTRMLDLCARAHDLTVVDMPLAVTDWTLAALKRADAVVLVTTPTVSGAAGARRLVDSCREAGVESKFFLVLNRVAGPLEGVERSDRISKVLGLPVEALLAEDPAARRASDRGRLVVDAFPTCRLAKDLKSAFAKIEARVGLQSVAVKA